MFFMVLRVRSDAKLIGEDFSPLGMGLQLLKRVPNPCFFVKKNKNKLRNIDFFGDKVMIFHEKARLLLHRFMFGIDWELQTSTFDFQIFGVNVFDNIYFFRSFFVIVLAKNHKQSWDLVSPMV